MRGDKIYYYDRGSFYVLHGGYHKETDQINPFYRVAVGIYPKENIVTDFVDLGTDGYLKLKYGFASDGPSGLTINTKSSMRTAFVHDGTFYLFRLKKLDLSWLPKANDNLRDFGIEDGMYSWRANLWHSKWVQRGMAPYAKKEERVYSAP